MAESKKKSTKQKTAKTTTKQRKGSSEIVAVLAESGFFAGLDDTHVAALADAASPLEADREHYLFRQDTRADTFYLILEGEVSVEVPAVFGQPLVLQTLGGGEVLGWSWLFEPHRWHFDARAVVPTRALSFDGEALRQWCEKDAAFGYAIMKLFARLMKERLEAARLKIMEERGPV